MNFYEYIETLEESERKELALDFFDFAKGQLNEKDIQGIEHSTPNQVNTADTKRLSILDKISKYIGCMIKLVLFFMALGILMAFIVYKIG